MSRKYAVIFEQVETNWEAYVPDLPGCISTGRTLEETERNVRDAISGHLQTLCEFGEPAPKATSVAKEIEVTPAASVPDPRLFPSSRPISQPQASRPESRSQSGRFSQQQ